MDIHYSIDFFIFTLCCYSSSTLRSFTIIIIRHLDSSELSCVQLSPATLQGNICCNGVFLLDDAFIHDNVQKRMNDRNKNERNNRLAM